MSSSDHYNSLSYSEEDDIQDDSYSDQSYNETRKRTVSKATKPKATMKRKSTGVPKKPGRKPISNVSDEELLKDPKAKRRVQNREAQRNFRERKEKFVGELQDRIQLLESEKSAKEADLEKEVVSLKEELAKLKEENYQLKGAKFTFNYPPPDHHQPDQPLASPPLSATPPSKSTVNKPLSDSSPPDTRSPASTSSVATISTPSSSTYDSHRLQTNLFQETASSTHGSSSDELNADLLVANQLFSHNPIDSLASLDLVLPASSTTTGTFTHTSSASVSQAPMMPLMSLAQGVSESLLFGTSLPNALSSVSAESQLPSSVPTVFTMLPQSMSTSHPTVTAEAQRLPAMDPISFGTYRNPATTVDDWLFTDIPPMINNEGAFGFQTAALPADTTPSSTAPMYTSHPMIQHSATYLPTDTQLAEVPSNGVNYLNPQLSSLPIQCKAKILTLVQQAKDQGKNRREVRDHVKSVCPTYDVDYLCKLMKDSSISYDPEKPFTDQDMTLVAHIIHTQ